MASRRLISKVVVSVAGALLIALGLVGIVLPILPGVIFVIGGLIVLSSEFVWAERALARARAWVEERRRSHRIDNVVPLETSQTDEDRRADAAG